MKALACVDFYGMEYLIFNLFLMYEQISFIGLFSLSLRAERKKNRVTQWSNLKNNPVSHCPNKFLCVQP